METRSLTEAVNCQKKSEHFKKILNCSWQRTNTPRAGLFDIQLRACTSSEKLESPPEDEVESKPRDLFNMIAGPIGDQCFDIYFITRA